MSISTFKHLKNPNISWFCSNCDRPNSGSPLQNCPVPIKNSFDPLTDDAPNKKMTTVDANPHPLTSPKNLSSPPPKKTPSPPTTPPPEKDQKLPTSTPSPEKKPKTPYLSQGRRQEPTSL